MFRWRKLSLAIAAAISVVGLAAIPSATADECTVTVTILGGQQLTFNISVPPGTPVSSIPLPLPASLVSESASCAPTPAPSPPTTSTSSSSTSTSNSTTSGPPQTTSPARSQPSSSHPHGSNSGGGVSGSGRSSGRGAGKRSTSRSGGAAPTATPTKPAPLRAPGGAPTNANPTFSFALPGPAPIGVPNFFIDSFRIPPFLLPIYQAAGIQYNVSWQILAGINEIETDYGRNLSVSSAGAVGWMQFLPSTWKTWGIDANGDGVADPYNPVDAIFSAARYLQAAGASKNVTRAIFAYNHAGWYVQSVLLRAKLIGGMPDQLVGALTGLVQGHFPVAAKAKYADDSVEKLATRRVHGANAAIPIESSGSKSVSIYARSNAPVIAANDGKIVKVGHSHKLGKFVELQDQTGNIYTYAHLGSVPREYAVPKVEHLSAKQLTKQLSLPRLPAPKAPASAGQQRTTPVVSTAKATKEAKQTPRSLPVTPQPARTQPTPASNASAGLVKERLFADPARPGSYASGGRLQIQNAHAQITSFQDYFSDVLHLGKNQYRLAPLRRGAIVVAGTILGHLPGPRSSSAPHMQFMIQPAGKHAPYIDPKPILDGWKLLEATAVYRAAGVDPFFGPGAKNPSIGQILLMSKEQLTNRVLQDPHVQIYQCGRRDIQSGGIDRRIMAVIEFLSASGLDPTISGLKCGHSITGANGVDAAGASGSSVDISKINNIPMIGHEGPGSITDMTIRRLLTLQGAMRPDQIISLMSYKGQANTLALPDHGNRLQIAYTPLFGSNNKLTDEIKTILKPSQWVKLINRIGEIREPAVPVTPSKYAIKKTLAPH